MSVVFLYYFRHGRAPGKWVIPSLLREAYEAAFLPKHVRRSYQL